MPISPVRDHTHTQSEANTTWTINHNLGFKPVAQVVVLNAGSDEVILPKSVTHPTVNQTVVTFSVARTGTVRLL